MKSKQIRLYFLLSMCAVFLLFLTVTLSFAVGLVLYPHITGQALASPSWGQVQEARVRPLEDVDVLVVYEETLNQIYENSIDSLVSVRVTKQLEGSRLFGRPNRFIPGQGSGFVWDTDGHIVTNHHVIVDVDQIQVIFADDRAFDAEVIDSDPEADIAVLKIHAPSGYLKPLPLGNNRDLKVGQLTIALGNPFGQEFTMTSGIVSAIGRTMLSSGSGFSIAEVVQTDAAINPGNSGGPLLNKRGEVVGINTMILSRDGSNSGVGLAVPISIVKEVVPTIISGISYEYAWLGIVGHDLRPELAEALDLPLDTTGAMVARVTSDGPAEDAGLRTAEEVNNVLDGDVITALDGRPVTGMEDLITYLASLRPGDEISLTVLRPGGEEVTIDVVLGTRPTTTQ